MTRKDLIAIKKLQNHKVQNIMKRLKEGEEGKEGDIKQRSANSAI